MAIIRYTASADNTITNAFTETILSSQRATGSNMGKSDVLEVFSIYGQSSGSTGVSSELSRVLIKFNTTKIASDRNTSAVLPASGSVNFYLCLYNAPHVSTLPEDYKLTVARVTNDWEEGYGLDMDNYTDKTYDGIGSNWVNAQGSPAAATLVDAIDLTGVSYGDKFTMTVPTSAGGDGVAHQFVFDRHTDIDNLSDTTGFGINTQHAADDAAKAAILINAINGTADTNNYQYGGAALSAGSTLAAGTLGLTAKQGSSTSKITLTMDDKGDAGNVAVLTRVTGFAGSKLVITAATGGQGPWTNFGGDFVTAANSGMDFVDVSFPDGDEDIKVDITSIVEGWVTTGNTNYGLIVKMSSSYEAYFSASSGADTATATHNTSGAKRSYYTKKFFGRGTEYYFKRPVIEARWDDSVKDDRGNIYLSSSLAPQADNLNKIYLYNYIRGKLTDIKGNSSEVPNVKFYYSSGSVPEGLPRTFIESNSSKTSNNATRISKGLYSISFAINKDQFPDGYPYLIDVWAHEGKEIHTGSAMLPKSFGFSSVNPNSQYVLAISNMRKYYNKDETARFRVSIRSKDWSPTIHTIASNNVELATVPSASYEIYRVIDEEIVIPFGTGSIAHTMLSHDVSGNYFDLDMGNLEPGYSYGVKISIYEDSIGSYREQPYTFKFRVRKDEY